MGALLLKKKYLDPKSGQIEKIYHTLLLAFAIACPVNDQLPSSRDAVRYSFASTPQL